MIRCSVFSFIIITITACGPSSTTGGDHQPDASRAPDAPTGDNTQTGCGGLLGCYSVYAHGDHMLYVVDLQAKTLETVGPFMAPTYNGSEDIITDLAVAPNNTIYVISEKAIYTASPQDGHITKVGSLTACGQRAVALTTTPDGKIYTGDYMGALCEIDVTHEPPVVKPPVTMANGLALSGDLVAVDDGTVYGTTYRLADTTTQRDNILVKVDLATGSVTELGPTGAPRLYGTSFALGKVFGFTHDGSGQVVTIDRTTGVSTPYATFTDPATNMGIAFAGAGVNSLVSPIL